MLSRIRNCAVVARTAYRHVNVRNMGKVVSIEEAKKMAKSYNEMPNDILLTMAVGGDQDAKEERLIREIMSVDNVSWTDAQPIFHKIVASNRSGMSRTICALFYIFDFQ